MFGYVKKSELDKLKEDNRILTGRLKDSNLSVDLLIDKNLKLQEKLDNGEWLPVNKPNIDSAVATISKWSDKTIVSMIKRLLKIVKDDVIVTINRYVNTEITKRKLTKEDLTKRYE